MSEPCPYCLTDCGHPAACGAELDEQPPVIVPGSLDAHGLDDDEAHLEPAAGPFALEEPEHHLEPPC